MPRRSVGLGAAASGLKRMRIGIFGGTFDPVHYGHLLLAELSREQARLEQVWFLPAAVPPHKQHRERSAGEHRMAMLNLAIGGHEPFSVSRLEIERGGISYTVDSLEALHASHPGHDWFLLLGADSLEDLPNWREPRRICELALPLVAARPGSSPPNFDRLRGLISPERLELARRQQIHMPQIELSSREMRDRVASGRTIRYFTPRAVEKYIESHGLYRSTEEAP
jgi:nicotinate-nucleotide adenylyltransferase